MIEKKIVVPEGMLKAAVCAGYSPDAMISSRGYEDLKDVVREKLEAALRWLSENPIAPTLGDLQSMSHLRPSDDIQNWLQHVAIEWQRRMFLAPEPEIGHIAKKVIRSFQGCTLTHADADAIVEELRRVTNGWDVGASSAVIK